MSSEELQDMLWEIFRGSSAFSWISTTITNGYSLEVDGELDSSSLVMLNNLIGECGDVDTGITLPSNVEVSSLVLWESNEEIDQSIQILFGHQIIINFIISI